MFPNLFCTCCTGALSPIAAPQPKTLLPSLPPRKVLLQYRSHSRSSTVLSCTPFAVPHPPPLRPLPLRPMNTHERAPDAYAWR